MGRASRGKAERRAREPGELEEHLQQQARLLARSAVAFDEGEQGEAARMATVIRVLCHDGQGRALLRQLGLMKTLQFHDTGYDRNPSDTVWGATLCALALGKDGGVLYAPGDRPPPVFRRVSFAAWWGRPILALNPTMNPHAPAHVSTRRELVTWLASQDGGAHVDEAIDAKYDDTRRASVGAFHHVDSSESPLPAPIRPSMRQVAHEMLATLSELTGEEPPVPPRPVFDNDGADDGQAYASFKFTITT